MELRCDNSSVELSSKVIFSFPERYKYSRFTSACEKPVEKATARQRRDLKSKRKEKKHDLLLTRRHIVEVVQEEVADDMQKNKHDLLVEERLAKLAEWRKQKKEKKEEEQKKKKPEFVVRHVDREVGKTDLDSVYKVIKGKLVNLDKHKKFNLPNSVKQLHRPDLGKENGGAKKQVPVSEKKVTAPKSEFRMVTRSQVKTTKRVPNNRIVEPASKKPRIKDNSNVIQRKKETPKSIRKVNKVKATTKPLVKIGSTEKKKETAQIAVTPSAKEELAATPQKAKEPVFYVSPFVTISRGKDSARKEYKLRRVGSVTPASKLDTLKKDTSKATSPKAAASYFYKILNDEIERIEMKCTDWRNYKTEENPAEEICDMIDVAIGQSQLLISKKFQQFRGLVDRCANDDGDMPVTCEDLHGFWDMVYIQVKNVDERFDNLTRLKLNDWEEILPEKKEVKKLKVKKKNNVAASAAIREAIKAARMKKETANCPVPERKSARKSLVQSVLISNTKKRISSPGLSMMKVTTAAKSVADAEGHFSPSRSILKVPGSVKKHVRSIMFEDNIKENNANLLNESTDVEENVKTPRRSSRLTRNKLF